jgi:hypothetical protein
MGMPLAAAEKATLAATPAASTFQRWPEEGRTREVGELDGMVQRSLSACKGFENQEIIN